MSVSQSIAVASSTSIGFHRFGRPVAKLNHFCTPKDELADITAMVYDNQVEKAVNSFVFHGV